VNENRDSYWDEVLSTVQNLLFSKACVSESDFPLNPTDEEKRFGYFYNGELYLWTGTNGTVRNGQYRSFGVVQGERGVGVSSIAQTSTSNVDGGKNEITVTLTNGDSYKFFTYNGTGRNKGYYYRTLDELKQAVPSPTVTDWAIVDGSVYVCDEAGVWKDTTYSWKPIKLNPFVTELNKMDMPTSTGYLYWDGQSFGWKTPVVNNGGGNTGGGTSIDLSEYSWWGRKFDLSGDVPKAIQGSMSKVTEIEFMSSKGETVNKKKLYLDENGDLCFDGNLYATGGITALGVGTTTGGGSSSSSRYPFTIYNGSSDNDYITYDGSSAAYLKFKNGFSISKVGLGYEISVSDGGSGSSSRINTIKLFNSLGNEFDSVDLGSANKIGFMQGDNVTLQAVVKDYTNVIKISANGGSGSSGTTSGKLRFYQDSSEETWNGESDFKIIFGSGLNVTWDSHSQITLSATGGSSTGGSVDLSSYLTKTEASTTYAAKSHNHLAADITNFASTVKGIKVDNATKADTATQLANSRTIWGQSFDGTGNISGNLYMGTAGGGSVQLWMNNGNMLDRTNNALHIGYGLKESSDGEIYLDAYRTVVYTDNMSKHYDFKSDVFDVNSNQIHFGSETNGGRISWDAANKAFKIEGNIYATGGITALGVSNSATTSNNVDFTFKSVTSKKNIIYADDNVPFKIYPKNNTKAALLFSYNGKNWSIYDDNYEDLYLQAECHIDSDGWIYSPQFLCYENGNMELDGASFHLGDTDNNVDVVFYYNGSSYKLDMSKAISVGVFATLSAQELSALQERKTKKKAVL
jgi:hypothetical protein